MMSNEIMEQVHSLRNNGYTWDSVADVMNAQTGAYKSKNAYRFDYYKWIKSPKEDPEEMRGQYLGTLPEADTWALTEDNTEDEDTIKHIYELKKEKMQMADYRNEVNRMYRRMAREDSIKEIAHNAAYIIAKERPFDFHPPILPSVMATKAGILCLSDWHYGAVIDSTYNKYDPAVCQHRLFRLVEQVHKRMKENECTELHVFNLGDLVSGIIHTQIRINNRVDVITQIMRVSELLANMLEAFAEVYKVHYYSTMDNHSRIMPEKKDSLDCESLCRITDWYVMERCHGLGITFHNNEFGDDIVTANVLGHKIAAAHGDKDTPEKIIQNLTLLTRQPYDLVLTAHRHHFKSEELNDCMMIANGSVMGTDSYAESLRLSNKPSQTFIISTYENVVDTIYKINLDYKVNLD